MAVALFFLVTIVMESEGFILTWKEKRLCLIYLYNLPIVNFQGFPKFVNILPLLLYTGIYCRSSNKDFTGYNDLFCYCVSITEKRQSLFS